MITQDLLNYIKTELAKGTPKDVIQSNLVSGGWDAKDVAEGFSALLPKPAPIPMSAPVQNPIQPIAQPIQPVMQTKSPVQPVAPIQTPVQQIQPITLHIPETQILVQSTIQPVAPVQNIQPATSFQPIAPVVSKIAPIQNPVQPVAQKIMPVQNQFQQPAQTATPIMNYHIDTHQKKSGSPLVMIILILLVLGGGAYAYYKYFYANNSQNQMNQNATTTQNTNTSNIESSSTLQNISTSTALQNTSTTSSIILSINSKDSYKINEYLTGATYNLSYSGPSFDAVILYKQLFTSTSVDGTMTATAYSIDFPNINNNGYTSNLTVLDSADISVSVNGQKGQSLNIFSNEGKYIFTMSVYKCSDIFFDGKCSSKNVLTSNIEKINPLKTLSKVIIVAGKVQATTTAGKTVLDCDYNKDPLCGQNYTDVFLENFKSCKISTGTAPLGMESLLGIFRSYKILGVQNSLCSVDFSILEASDSPYPTLLNKTMNCKYTDAERNLESVAVYKNCTGPLYDEFQKLNQ